MSMVAVFAIYLALGAFAGTLAGLFGIGGGLIIVSVLIFSFGLQGFSPDVAAHMAVGTSLATIVFTSLSSIKAHQGYGAIRWDIFRPMTLGIILGAFLGAWTAALLSGAVLELVIGVFIILIGLKMLFDVKPSPGRSVPGKSGLGVAGASIGWASAIFGIGGGSLTVPFLSWCNIRMQQAVGTSAACGLPIAVAGAIGNIWAGWHHADVPEYSLGFVYIPAVVGIILTSVLFARVGANLAHRLNAKVLKQIFAIMLLLVGLNFLLN